jgi:hypothetical protein
VIGRLIPKPLFFTSDAINPVVLLKGFEPIPMVLTFHWVILCFISY